MKSLARRVRKLERRGTDATGLIPHSEAWYDYWIAELIDLIEGRRDPNAGMIPIEVLDRGLEEYDAKHADNSLQYDPFT